LLKDGNDFSNELRPYVGGVALFPKVELDGHEISGRENSVWFQEVKKAPNLVANAGLPRGGHVAHEYRCCQGFSPNVSELLVKSYLLLEGKGKHKLF
jgi:hypothetical protein